MPRATWLKAGSFRTCSGTERHRLAQIEQLNSSHDLEIELASTLAYGNGTISQNARAHVCSVASRHLPRPLRVSLRRRSRRRRRVSHLPERHERHPARHHVLSGRLSNRSCAHEGARQCVVAVFASPNGLTRVGRPDHALSRGRMDGNVLCSRCSKPRGEVGRAAPFCAECFQIVHDEGRDVDRRQLDLLRRELERRRGSPVDPPSVRRVG